jgi:gamma-glutamylaminecyclotransferase
MTTRLFVYGTLMRGEHHHGTLAGARFAGSARTLPQFALALVDYYPAMSRGGASAVAGELYDVDAATLAALDELEDVPTLYLRERLVLADGSAADAYVLPAERLPPGAVPIPAGDFRALPAKLRAPR